MDSSATEKSNIQEGILKGPLVLSSYGASLESHIKKRYLKKISVVGVDPSSLPTEQFSPECLPSIEVSDLLSYARVKDIDFSSAQKLKEKR